MFSTTPDTSNALCKNSYTAFADRPKCTSDLSTTTFSTPKSASSFNCPGKVIAPTTTPVDAAGYGGSVTITPSVEIVPAVTTPKKQPCASKSGGGRLGVESERPQGQRPGGSRDNDRDDRSPLKTIANKCNDAKNWVTGLVTPPAPQPTVGAAGYGGTVTTPVVVTTTGGGFMGNNGGTGFGCKPVHFNQGIGNGAEGGDPGKSRPRGGSNDEGGRTPGRRC